MTCAILAAKATDDGGKRMGFGDPTTLRTGVQNRMAGQDDWSSVGRGAGYLSDHPAVVKHGDGVSSEELASFIEAFASYSRTRITGTGAESYGKGTRQAFEDMSFDRLVIELVDEISDAQNYLSLLAVKALGMLGAQGE